MDENGLPNGMSAMLGNAIVLHEFYTSLTDAGFAPEQATYLTGVTLAELLKAAPDA